MLDDKTKKTLKKIVKKHLPDKSYKTFVFGSRADGTNRKFSDIDLGIKGPKIDGYKKVLIEEEFEQSDLPYRVDVVDFSTTSDKFKKIAMQKVVYL